MNSRKREDPSPAARVMARVARNRLGFEATPETCPVCRHEPAVQHIVYPDEEPPETRASCPMCGRTMGVILRVVYEDEA
jgi:hypothetical protein